MGMVSVTFQERAAKLPGPRIMKSNSQKSFAHILDLPNPGCICFLGGGFKYFLFSPLVGEDYHFD